MSINTAAILRPELIREGARRFGSQCIVVAVDAKRKEEGRWEVYTYGGREPTGRDVLEWVVEANRLVVGVPSSAIGSEWH